MAAVTAAFEVARTLTESVQQACEEQRSATSTIRLRRISSSLRPASSRLRFSVRKSGRIGMPQRSRPVVDSSLPRLH